MWSDEGENLIKERKNLLKSVIRDFFGDEMKLYEETKSFGRFGSFRLKYIYTPCEYRLIIDHEFRKFYITIRKKDESFIKLNQIVDYNNRFEKYNIYKVMAFLKKTLNEKILNEKIYFYKIEEESFDLYEEQKDGTYKKVEISLLDKKARRKL